MLISPFKGTLFLLLLMILSSCSRSPQPEDYKPGHTSFQINVDSNGMALFQRKAKGRSDLDLLREDIGKLKKHLSSKKEYGRLIIYVHGGLVSPKAAAKSAYKITEKICRYNEGRSSKEKIFPVFVNWDTGPISSYGRHLVRDDAGISYAPSPARSAVLMAGLLPKIAGDLGAGLSKAPVNLVRANGRWMSQAEWIQRTAPGAFPLTRTYHQLMKERYQHSAGALKSGLHEPYRKQTSGLPFHLELGEDQLPRLTEKGVMNVLWSPAKILTSPLGESFGPSSWDNMMRRARLMSFRIATDVSSPGSAQGGPGVMLTLLNELCSLCREIDDIELELYGHSMGTIVLNEAIGGYHLLSTERLKTKRIVYMAAACRISDFAHTTGRYVTRSGTEFHNLCLHPKQEVRETLWSDFGSPLVAGSLLTWVDEMIERPPSNATSGKRTSLR